MGEILEKNNTEKMNQKDLEEIVNYIAKRGIEAIKTHTEEINPSLDYLAIFSKDEGEFKRLLQLVELLGEEIDKEVAKTGRTFLLHKPLSTSAGPLQVLKIRRPDPTRPQRGAPDFKISNYAEFKEKYLSTSGSFTLMIRKDYEMIELKGIDVLVYFPSLTLTERL